MSAADDMMHDKHGRPPRARASGLAERPADHPANLYRDVPPSCLIDCSSLAAVFHADDQRLIDAARSQTLGVVTALAGTARVSDVTWQQLTAEEAGPHLDRVEAGIVDSRRTSAVDELAVVHGLRAFLARFPPAVVVSAGCWVDRRVRNASQS